MIDTASKANPDMVTAECDKFDPEAINKSAEKFRSLGNRTIYYGHGKPTPNGRWGALYS